MKRFSNHEGFFAKLSVNYAHDMFFGTEGVLVIVSETFGKLQKH